MAFFTVERPQSFNRRGRKEKSAKDAEDSAGADSWLFPDLLIAVYISVLEIFDSERLTRESLRCHSDAAAACCFFSPFCFHSLRKAAIAQDKDADKPQAGPARRSDKKVKSKKDDKSAEKKDEKKEEPKEEKKGGMTADTFSGLKFRLIGPAVASGRVMSIAVNPKNKFEYYVGVASGGVWKTVNDGTTWTPVFDGEGSYSDWVGRARSE